MDRIRSADAARQRAVGAGGERRGALHEHTFVIPVLIRDPPLRLLTGR